VSCRDNHCNLRYGFRKGVEGTESKGSLYMASVTVKVRNFFMRLGCGEEGKNVV